MAEADGIMPTEWNDLLRAGGAVRLGVDDLRELALEEWAQATDRVLVTLDTQDATTEAELIRAIGIAFGCDEDDELEWDDVDECLADHDVAPASGMVIVWTGWDNLDDDPEHVLPVAVDAFGTAVRTWTDEGRPWAVLMAGEGPSWELPWAGAGTAPWEDDLDLDLDDDDDDWAEDDLDDSYELTDDRAEESPDVADRFSNW